MTNILILSFQKMMLATRVPQFEIKQVSVLCSLLLNISQVVLVTSSQIKNKLMHTNTHTFVCACTHTGTQDHGLSASMTILKPT